MLTSDEFDKLASLLNHLHVCLGVKLSLMDEQAAEVFSSSEQADFCRAVKRAQGGRERCIACDRQALSEMTPSRKMKRYRCHCGLTEVAMPVVENGRVVAAILIGQFLDTGDKKQLWQNARSLLDWYPDADDLEEAFMRLRQVSSEQLFSLTEIVHACISEVRLQGMLSAREMSDASRLQSYVLQYFAQPITLSSLCEEMHMGKSKLFDLCRREFQATPGQLILRTRVEAAKELLSTTAYDLSQIAQMVGIADVHYFCKRFKLACGETPGSYRRRMAAEGR